MQMSEKEIVRSYTNAKDKRSQVGVLAELNACPNDTIREILERNGISAPKPGRKSQKKKETPQDELKEEFQMAGGVITIEDPGKRMFLDSLATPRQPKTVLTEKAKLLLKNEEQTESSDLSAPSDSSKLRSQNEVGTKSEKVITLGDLIDLIDRDRENSKTISIMDENGEEQIRVITWSPFLEELEDYAVTSLDVGDNGWICVWLGEKKRDE